MTKEPQPPRLVRDLMSVGVPTCGLSDQVRDLTDLLLEKGWEALVVLDERGHAAGFVGRDDLVAAYIAGEAGALPAEAVMSNPVPQVPADIPLVAAAQIMRDQGVRVLYIMHHAGGVSYPAAYLSYQHFLRHLAALDAAELHDLGIKAERESPLETFIRRRDEARRRATPPR